MRKDLEEAHRKLSCACGVLALTINKSTVTERDLTYVRSCIKEAGDHLASAVSRRSTVNG